MWKKLLIVALVLSLSPQSLWGQMSVETSSGVPGIYIVNADDGTSSYLQFQASEHQLYVSSGLEVSGDLEVNGNLWTTSGEIWTLKASDIELFNPGFPGKSTYSIFFPAGGVARAESMTWNDSKSRFELSDTLQLNANLVAGTTDNIVWNSFGNRSPVSGDIASKSDLMVSDDLEVGLNLTVGGVTEVGTSLYLGGTSDGDQTIYFREGSATGRSLAWDDSENRFEMNDALALSGSIATAVSLAGSAIGFNALGGTDPSSGQIVDGGDLFVDNDVEVEGALYLSKTLYMEGHSSSTANGDQTIYFFDDGRAGEYLRWNDTSNVFEFSTVLSLDKVIGGTTDLDLSARQDIEFMIDSNNTPSANETWRLYHDGGYALTNKLAEFREDGDLLIRGNFDATAFDLAERFLMSESVRAGDLVRVDPQRSDAVRLASSAEIEGLLGVVSEDPGFVLGGTGFAPEDLEHYWGPELRQRFEQERGELEAQLLDEHGELAAVLASVEEADFLSTGEEGPRSLREATERAEVVYAARQELTGLALERFGSRHLTPVALAGRVRVNADASAGPIAVGDPLTAGEVLGVAVKATAAGPIIGTALEALDGGRGKVLAMIHLGWYGGNGAGAVGDPGETRARQDSEATSVETSRILVTDGNGARGTFSVARRGVDGAESELLRLDAEGNLFVQGSIRSGAQTVAEYRMVSEPVAVGDVLVADRAHRGLFKRGETAGDTAVVGIAAGHAGVLTGTGVAAIAEVMPELADALEAARVSGNRDDEESVWRQMRQAFEAVHAPIAMSGIVRARADASHGAIQVGDLLTTSATRGHVMLAAEATPGAIVGKALESLEAGSGLIEILVMLR